MQVFILTKMSYRRGFRIFSECARDKPKSILTRKLSTWDFCNVSIYHIENAVKHIYEWILFANFAKFTIHIACTFIYQIIKMNAQIIFAINIKRGQLLKCPPVNQHFSRPNTFHQRTFATFIPKILVRNEAPGSASMHNCLCEW